MVQEAFPLDCLLENATVRGRAWYNCWDAPVLNLDVAVGGGRSNPPYRQPHGARVRHRLLRVRDGSGGVASGGLSAL